MMNGNMAKVEQEFKDFRSSHPRKSKKIKKWTLEWIESEARTQDALIFLPGTVGSPEIFWQQLLSLGDHYKVISLDVPPISDLSTLTSVIHRFLRVLEIDRCVIAGTSFGGYLAQWVASEHGEPLKGLVLGNTFHDNRFLREEHSRIVKILRYIPAFLVKRVVAKGIRRDLTVFSNYPAFTTYMRWQLENMASSKIKARLDIVLKPVSAPPSPSSDLPLLLLHSENDPLIPLMARKELDDTYPTAEKLYFPSDAGHFPYLTYPEQYTEKIRSFLAKIF